MDRHTRHRARAIVRPTRALGRTSTCAGSRKSDRRGPWCLVHLQIRSTIHGADPDGKEHRCTRVHMQDTYGQVQGPGYTQLATCRRAVLLHCSSNARRTSAARTQQSTQQSAGPAVRCSHPAVHPAVRWSSSPLLAPSSPPSSHPAVHPAATQQPPSYHNLYTTSHPVDGRRLFRPLAGRRWQRLCLRLRLCGCSSLAPVGVSACACACASAAAGGGAWSSLAPVGVSACACASAAAGAGAPSRACSP